MQICERKTMQEQAGTESKWGNLVSAPGAFSKREWVWGNGAGGEAKLKNVPGLKSISLSF